MNKQDYFSSAQIISLNPILKENSEIRIQYFEYLKKLIYFAKWNRRKFIKEQIEFYKKKLCDGNDDIKIKNNEKSYAYIAYLIPFDLSMIMMFNSKVLNDEKIDLIIEKIVLDYNLSNKSKRILKNEFAAVLGDEKSWNNILRNKSLKEIRNYLRFVRKNVLFINKKPFNILITATMSAGKSTLINALVGKNISLMQNMACTSKIHTIVSKPVEDGITSEYDYNYTIDATKEELLNDHDDNKLNKLFVSTYFNSLLGGQRLVLFDSPGVNSSENIDHMEISRKMIYTKKYNLMFYVLNATQLRTEDDEKHLEFVLNKIGRTKIIFILNMVDHLISECEDISSVIERQRKYLISKGYKKPIILPVSARAAYLVKKSKYNELTKLEQREIENCIDKFEQFSLAPYYESISGIKINISSLDEVQNLFANCGFAYLEKIIVHIIKGGKINDTDICKI